MLQTFHDRERWVLHSAAQWPLEGMERDPSITASFHVSQDQGEAKPRESHAELTSAQKVQRAQVQRVARAVTCVTRSPCGWLGFPSVTSNLTLTLALRQVYPHLQVRKPRLR